MVILAVGSGLAGLAGGLYAFYYQYLSPSQFDVLQSAAILTMVVIGGMGTALGPVVGDIPAAGTAAGNHVPATATQRHGAVSGHPVLHAGAAVHPVAPAGHHRRPPASHMTEVIRLEGVHKRFGGIVVAEDINLAIGQGDILGLIGPNGAGKTSLFNLISGVVSLDAGQHLSRRPTHRRRCHFIAVRALASRAPGSICGCSTP